MMVLLLYLWMFGSALGWDIYFASLAPVCVTLAVLALLPLLNIVVHLASWKTLQKRVRYALLAVVCCIPTVSVLFFEAYNFWS
jgi:hypothetical protein